MAHPLAGVDLKLAEAYKRLHLLDDTTVGFRSLKRQTLVRKVDPATGDYVFRFPGKLPPLEIGLEVGIVAHLLRSALDNMLWQLVFARGGTPTDHHQFPIYEERAEFERKAHGTTKARWETGGVSPRDFAFIQRHQPFKRGRYRAKWHPLALLAHLNNVDKHRYVHPRFGVAAAMVIQWNKAFDSISADTPRPFFLPRLRDERRARRRLEIVSPLYGRGVDFSGSDDDPAEVARMSGKRRPKPRMHMEPGITLDVSFSDRARPVSTDDFFDIWEEVQSIIDHFRPFIG